MRRLLWLAALAALAACGKPAVERPRLAKAGLPAPELRLPVLLNAPLPELAGWQQLKGRAVVLEFWAGWSDPSTDAVPHLNELAARFRDKPVVLISITDESEADVTAFLKDHRVEGWTAPAAPPEVFKAFRVYNRPHAVLVDRDGVVRAFTTPSQVNAGTIEELLAGRLGNDEGKDAARHADEDKGPAPDVLAEFYMARSSGTAYAKYRNDHFYARAMTLRMAFNFIFGPADVLDLGPGTREAVDASYDIRLTAPSSGPDRKPELFARGLAFATGLKVSAEQREEEVYVLRTAPGGLRGPRRRQESAPVSFDGVTLRTAGASFAALALQLGEKLGRPVLDETRENGPLEYSFTFETRDPKAADAQLRRALGLRLDKARRKVRVVTVRK